MSKNVLNSNAIRALLMVVVMSLFSMVGLSQSYAAGDSPQGGEWTDKKYDIEGGWEISREGDSTVIRFDENFVTKKGPDLKIFLSTKSIDDVTGKTVVGSSVMVAELKSHKGAQEYVLPADLNIDDYASLLIHCEAYSVLWGGAGI